MKKHNLFNDDIIKSYEDIIKNIKKKLKQEYSGLYVQHRATQTVLTQFRDNDDPDCSPTICFCLRIFKDLNISLWRDGVKIPNKQFKTLLSKTRSVLGRWSQLYELLRYSKDLPEVDILTKSTDVANQVLRLGELSENKKMYTFLADQLKLLCQAPSRYRYEPDAVNFANNIYHKSHSCYNDLKTVLCLPSVRMLQALSAVKNKKLNNISADVAGSFVSVDSTFVSTDSSFVNTDNSLVGIDNSLAAVDSSSIRAENSSVNADSLSFSAADTLVEMSKPKVEESMLLSPPELME